MPKNPINRAHLYYKNIDVAHRRKIYVDIKIWGNFRNLHTCNKCLVHYMKILVDVGANKLCNYEDVGCANIFSFLYAFLSLFSWKIWKIWKVHRFKVITLKKKIWSYWNDKFWGSMYRYLKMWLSVQKK